ncbi:MAG TPA: Gfo/Idh/MocA family oxidoreductase [Pirellulales bacterium]|nr:Gfo/Idh/MocA family oxidoreductase [Pirellulales bacterium]
MTTTPRRSFLKTSAMLGGAALVALPTTARSAASSNDRFRVAVVGLGGRGRVSHCGALLEMIKENVEIAALCDCDESRMQLAASFCESKSGKRPALVADYRRLLEDKSIDGVALATPNHWHALQTIWACQAGKDVYVEKPASHNIFEGRQMIEAARKYQRIVQHGTQCRTSPKIREGIEKLQAGAIGRVYMARGIAFKVRAGGRRKVEAVPAGMDWDAWVGPAPMEPYNKLAIGRWRFLKNYGNGEIGDQGVHQLDIIRWGLGLETHPTKVQSMGGRFAHPDDDEDTPGNQVFACEYQGKELMITFETRDWYTNSEAGMGIEYPFVDHRNVVGVIFIGSDGYMIFPDYSSYHTFLGPKRERGPSASVDGSPMMDLDQFQNWVAACRSRKYEELTADIAQGHLSSCLAHLANIAYATGRTLKFDSQKEVFTGDDEANRLLTRDYRSPYVVPGKV